jgi:hypothetical protein
MLKRIYLSYTSPPFSNTVFSCYWPRGEMSLDKNSVTKSRGPASYSGKSRSQISTRRPAMGRSHFWALALTVTSSGNRRPRRNIFGFPNTWKSKGAESWLYCEWGGVQKWLREQEVSHRQGLENFIVCYGRCLKKFGKYV